MSATQTMTVAVDAPQPAAPAPAGFERQRSARPGLQRSRTAPTGGSSMHVLMKPLREAVYKETHKKYMKDMFKSVHQMRQVANMSPEQKRQAILAVGVGLSLATKRKVDRHIPKRVKILLAIVMVPILLPIVLVVGLPLLLLGLPVIAFGTTILTLNAKANAIMNMNKRAAPLQGKQSRFASMYKSFYGTTNNPSLNNGDGEEAAKKPIRRSLSFRRPKTTAETANSAGGDMPAAGHVKPSRFRPAPIKRSRTYTFGGSSRSLRQ